MFETCYLLYIKALEKTPAQNRKQILLLFLELKKCHFITFKRACFDGYKNIKTTYIDNMNNIL